MCGLVGLYGKELGLSEEKAFKYMLYFDQFRGEHSTGVMIASKSFIGNETQVEVLKTLGSPSNLYDKHGKFQGKTSLTNKSRLFCLLGHNRYATQGGISEETAHPFEMGEVIGAHNGTVLKYTLAKLFEADKYEVDSQRIYSHLGQGNPITDVWEVADGAMALTWFNKTDDKLRIIRNKERPLWLTLSKDKKRLFWSSEVWMTIVATQLSKIEVEEPVALKENVLVEVEVDEEGLVKMTETEIPPFVRKAWTSPTNHYSRNFYGWPDDDEIPFGKGKDEKPKVKRPLEFRILEVHKGPGNPKAFGKALSEDMEVQVTLPAGPRGVNLMNNIIQRGKNRGYYVTSDHYEIWQGGKKVYFVNMNNVVYVKKKSRRATLSVPGFNGVYLSEEQYTRAVQCGCLNCNKIPSFKEGHQVRWITAEEFACPECLTNPWMDDLIEQFTQQQMQA